jgi:hypothetical protein
MLIALFDKSFIHGISVDEAVVFDQHFMSNITPLFFVEVLGDLETQDVTEGDRRTTLVRSLAAKTPESHSYPNVPHYQLVTGELMGHPVEMKRRPIVGGGRRVQNEDGLSTIFDEPPEIRAKNRWHEGHFEEREYELAKAWREMLAANPAAMERLLKGSAGRFSFRDYAAIKTKADELIDKGTRLNVLRAALDISHLPPEMYPQVLSRWKTAGGPSLREFAPYAAFVLSVDLFRVLAMGSGHMSSEKTSNYADLAYLYYLPFCQVFISTDKIHRHCAPLFMDMPRQAFVWGPELRPVLAELVTEYLAEPDLQEVGLMGIAGRRTFGPDHFLGALYQKFYPGRMMGDHDRDLSHKLSPEAEARLVAEIKKRVESGSVPSPDTDLSQEDRSMTIKRMVRHRKGSFPVLPKRVIVSSGE